MKDSFEVEVKFPVPNHDTVIAALTHIGLHPKLTEHQNDRYFNHPCRDFAKSDEALRIRHTTIEHLQSPSQSGTEHFELTYKGPKIDPLSKTRVEINTSIQNLDEVAAVLGHLGFRTAGVVTKTRTIYDMDDIEICIDIVEGLGVFVELESAAETEEEVPTVRDALLRLAEQIGLDTSTMIRTSYLELILEKDGSNQD